MRVTLTSELRSALVRYPCRTAYILQSTQLAGTGTSPHRGLGKVRQAGWGDEEICPKKGKTLTPSFLTTCKRSRDIYLFILKLSDVTFVSCRCCPMWSAADACLCAFTSATSSLASTSRKTWWSGWRRADRCWSSSPTPSCGTTGAASSSSLPTATVWSTAACRWPSCSWRRCTWSTWTLTSSPCCRPHPAWSGRGRVAPHTCGTCSGASWPRHSTGTSGDWLPFSFLTTFCRRCGWFDGLFSPDWLVNELGCPVPSRWSVVSNGRSVLVCVLDGSETFLFLPSWVSCW